MNINHDNYELYLFRYKEGLLDDKEKLMVEKAINENQAWREMADMYDPDLRLSEYEDTTYPFKERLKKIPSTSSIANNKRKIVWIGISIAASVVVALAIGLRQIASSGPNPQSVPPAITASTDASSHFDLDEKEQINNSFTNDTIQRMQSLAPIDACVEENNYDELAILPKEENITITDKLIKYIDDTNDKKAEVIVSEKLITYIETNDTSIGRPPKNNEINNIVEDIKNTIQLASLDYYNSVIEKFSN